MSSDKEPVTIKKYANRRLYNTGTSAYVTLEDLAAMVKTGDDFVVFDAKTGDEITRSVLTQIIFEQEGKSGQNLLPITFLRQLIRFYGDSMQMLVPSYLEFSLDKLTKERGGFGAMPDVTRPMFAQMEEQTRQNMVLFRQALSLFNPFGAAEGGRDCAKADGPTSVAPASTGAGSAGTETATAPPPNAPGDSGEFETMRRQLDELQRRVEGLMPKV